MMTVVLALMMSGCATTYIDSSQGRDGLSIQNAVIVGSVRAEYLYIDRTYAGANILSQMVTDNNGNPYDVVTIRTKDGGQKTARRKTSILISPSSTARRRMRMTSNKG